MGNTKIGLIDVVIAGEPHQMRFSFGAIIEVEEHFGVGNTSRKLDEIFNDTSAWSMRDFATVLAIALRRGSLEGVSNEEIFEMMLFDETAQYGKAIGQAFAAANTGKSAVDERPTRAAKAVKKAKKKKKKARRASTTTTS